MTDDGQDDRRLRATDADRAATVFSTDVQDVRLVFGAAVAPWATAVTRCPRCHSGAVSRWGKARREKQSPHVVQRWRCSGCCRTFSATTGTLLQGLHAPRKFQAVLADMLGPTPTSCRDLARRLGVDKTTVWEWRTKVAAVLATHRPSRTAAPMLLAETIVRESRKASRMWVDHTRDPQRFPEPDRWRWLDYRLRRIDPPDRLPQFRIPVRLFLEPTRDRLGAMVGDGTSGDPSSSGAAVPAPARSPGLEDPPSRETHYPRAQRRRHSTSMPAAKGARPSIGAEVADRDEARARRAATPDRLRSFLRPFRGPATKYLAGYVAWFIARITIGPAMTAAAR